MSEETQAKIVEDENPSAAEQETKVLKKMGADIGEESITKVDLRQTKEETNAVQEQSTDESVLRGSGTDEKTGEETEVELQEVQQEESQLTLEEVIDEETKEEPKEDPIGTKRKWKLAGLEQAKLFSYEKIGEQMKGLSSE